MSKGEKVALLIKTVVMFVLLGLVIFQNMRLDVTSRIASEIHYRFFYILSDKFHSQHLFEHISRDRDFDTFLVNYLAPSLFLGKDSIQNIEESKLFLNLADTRKEMLILDNMQLLSNFAGQYGWEVDIQEDAVAEGSQGAEGDTQAGGEVAADQTLAGLLDASGRGLSAEILPPNESFFYICLHFSWNSNLHRFISIYLYICLLDHAILIFLICQSRESTTKPSTSRHHSKPRRRPKQSNPPRDPNRL